jgi:hypothetical protein
MDFGENACCIKANDNFMYNRIEKMWFEATHVCPHRCGKGILDDSHACKCAALDFLELPQIPY